jgi:hypothetical protein
VAGRYDVVMSVRPGLTKEKVKKRLELLLAFKEALLTWANQEQRASLDQQMAKQIAGHDIPPDKAAVEARDFINMNLSAVQQALRALGLARTARVPNGPTMVNVDPFENIFNFEGKDVLRVVFDTVQRAIGDYVHIRDETGLITSEDSDTFDLKGTIERSLRVSFPKKAPEDELAVQDQVAVILEGQGLIYTREQDGAAGAVKTFYPDFVVEALDLAIEVKYSRPGRALRLIEEEMAADVTGFQRRWKRLLFIVYDNQQIVNVEAFRRAHMKLTGVDVVVVKH